MSTTMKYTLMSSDGESFEVDEPVAMMSITIKHLIDDDCFESGIPLPNVSAKILVKVIEYCKEHAVVVEKTDGEKDDVIPRVSADVDAAGDALKVWDKEFVAGLDQPTLFELIMAANYLNIKNLLDLTCQTVADLIKDMQPEEVRTIFNVVNDFTEDEEKAVRAENEWAFK